MPGLQIFGMPKWKPQDQPLFLGKIGKQILNLQSFRFNLRFGVLLVGSSLSSG